MVLPLCYKPVVPNLGSMDPLVVHKIYQGVHRTRNFVLQLIGGGPQPKKVENRAQEYVSNLVSSSRGGARNSPTGELN